MTDLRFQTHQRSAELECGSEALDSPDHRERLRQRPRTRFPPCEKELPEALVSLALAEKKAQCDQIRLHRHPLGLPSRSASPYVRIPPGRQRSRLLGSSWCPGQLLPRPVLRVWLRKRTPLSSRVEQ